MWMFISVEGQNCTEIGLSDILSDTVSKLRSITSLNEDMVKTRYGEEFLSISIIPVCIDDSMWKCLGWKERILVLRKAKEADIRLRLDYFRFLGADNREKNEMFIDIIVKSIEELQLKSKNDFNGKLLIEDIIKALR